MRLSHFRLVLLVRFLGYTLFITGIFGVVFTFGPLIQVEAGYRYDQIFGIKHTIPTIITSDDQSGGAANFGSVATEGEIISKELLEITCTMRPGRKAPPISFTKTRNRMEVLPSAGPSLGEAYP